MERRGIPITGAVQSGVWFDLPLRQADAQHVGLDELQVRSVVYSELKLSWTHDVNLLVEDSKRNLIVLSEGTRRMTSLF